jgi:hypothetical protein
MPIRPAPKKNPFKRAAQSLKGVFKTRSRVDRTEDVVWSGDERRKEEQARIWKSFQMVYI